MRKLRLNYLLAMLAMSVLWGCKDDPSYGTYLTVDNSALEFPISGGSVEFNINSDARWNIVNVPDWVSISSQRGENNSQIVVTATTNEGNVLRRDSLLIQTGDGGKRVFVNLIQDGFSKGNALFNVPDVSKRWMNGDVETTYGSDSIYVESNVPWTIKGPLWLRAEFNGKPVSMLGTSSLMGSGTLRIHPHGNIYTDEDREGEVIILSNYSDETYSIPVAQLGAGRLEPINPLIMAHGMATKFKYGLDIENVQYKFFEGNATDEEVTCEEANNWKWHYGFKENSLFTTFKRNPNTQYEMCLRSSKDGYYNTVLNRIQFTTLTDVDQPEVEISNLRYYLGRWYWTAIKNQYASGFYMIIFFGSYDENDELYWAYEARNLIQNVECEIYSDGAYNFKTTDNILIVAWALGNDQTLSNVISVKAGIKNAASSSYGVTLQKTDSKAHRPVVVNKRFIHKVQ